MYGQSSNVLMEVPNLLVLDTRLAWHCISIKCYSKVTLWKSMIELIAVLALVVNTHEEWFTVHHLHNRTKVSGCASIQKFLWIRLAAGLALCLLTISPLAEKILSAGTQLVYFIWRQTCSCNVVIMGEVCCVAMYMYNYTIRISGNRRSAVRTIHIIECPLYCPTSVIFQCIYDCKQVNASHYTWSGLQPTEQGKFIFIWLWKSSIEKLLH